MQFVLLIPHASKIVLGIIHQRMLSYYEQELSEISLNECVYV